MQNTFTPYKDRYISKFKKKREDEANERLNQMQLQIDQLASAYSNQQNNANTNFQVQEYKEENPKELLPSFFALPLKGFKGIAKGLEGLVDATVTLAAAPGAIGQFLGINTDDQWAKDFVSRDFTQETIGDWVDDVYHQSWWDNSKVGNWVGEAVQGVGSMLPSIAMNAIIPGSGLPLMGFQAGGNSVEEALNMNPNASLSQATVYGTLSGLTEVATEKMFDVFKIFGGGYADKLVNKFTKSKFLRIASGLVGEGVEEVASDLVNPISLKISGIDQNAAAPTASELLDSFVVGTMTSAMMGGANAGIQTIKYGPTGYKINNSINNILENQSDVLKQYDKVLKDSLTTEEYTRLKNDTIKHNQLLQELIEKYKNGTLENDTKNQKKLNQLMELNESLVSQMDEALNRYTNTHTAEQVEKFLNKKTNFRDINNEKISRVNITDEARTIAKPLTLEQKQSIIHNKNMEYKYNAETAKYRPEYKNLSKESQVELDKMVNNVNKLTQGKIRVAVDYDNKIIKSTDNAFFDPDGKTIVINANNINKTDVTKNVTMHELNHYLEGTKNGKALHDFVIKNMQNTSSEEYQKLFKTKKALYDNASDEFIEQEMVGDWLAKNMFTSQTSVEEVVNNNKSIGKTILDWINKKLDYMSKTKVEKSEYNFLEKAQSMFEKAIKDANIQKNVDNQTIKKYNRGTKGEINYGDDFRRLQEESRGMSSEEQQLFRSGSKSLNDRELRRYRVVFQKEINAIRNSKHLNKSTLVNPKTNNHLNIIENIDGNIFHDIFEISRTYLKNGELVDLHDNYNDSTCYLSDDGLSGFAITESGDLISVYNLGEKGFLDTISTFIKEKGAKTLDCYASPNQPLNLMYEKKLGFKTASIMDYNMEYDHDNIAKNHSMPQVAFMINTTENVETKHFTKDQYDEAVKYRDSFLKKDNKRYSKDETITETKLKAELNQEKVYSYKETSQMVDEFINTFTSSNKAYFEKGKGNVAKQFFTELNKGNINYNKLANDLANNMINNLVIDGTKLDASYKAIMLDELIPQVQAMLKNGGKTATVESLKNYYKDRINYLNSRVKYYREVSAESNKVFKKIESLKKITSRDYKFNPNAQHIADSMRGLTEVLKKINTSSDVARADIRNVIAEYGQYYNLNNSDSPLNDYINPEILDYIQYISNNANDPSIKKSRLSLEELNMVKNIAADALKMIRDYDTAVINDKKVILSEHATVASQQVNKNKRQYGQGVINKAIRSLEKPFEIMRDLEFSIGNQKGNLTTTIVEPLQQADLKYKTDMLSLRADVDEFNSKNKGYSKKRLVKQTIDVKGNNVTVGQAIYLTMLAKRPQAQSHFMIDVNENAKGIQLYDDKNRKSQVIKLTTEDISNIESQLTDTDKAYRTMAEKIFNEKARQIKIDTDNRYLGYTNLIEDYYVPITTVDDTRWKNYGDARQYKSIDSLFGLYFNQATIEGASNTIRLFNINDVLDKHIDLISKYDAYVEPVKNIQRFLNTKIEVNNEQTTLRNEISKKWIDFDKYLNDILMSQVNVNYNTDGFSKAMAKLRSAWAKSVLGVNIKSWVNQLTGIPTAAAIINYSSLTKAVAMKNTIETRKEMDKYTRGYTEYRNYDREVFKNDANITQTVNMVGDVLTKPMSSVDRFSIGMIWNACQIEIQSKNGYKIGTEENKVKAGELLNDVLRKTQEASTAIDKPAISRSSSELLKGVMMFTNQSMQCLSLLTSSAKEYLRVKQAIKMDGKTDANLTALKQSKTRMVKAATSVTISNLLAALVGTMFTKFLGKDDDKEEFLKQLGGNFAEQTVGMIPIARDIYGKFINGYDITDSSFNMINQLFDASKSLFANAANGKLSSSDINKFIYNLAALGGIPLKNIESYIYGILNTFNPEIAFKYKNLFFGTSLTQQYAVLEDAIKDNDIDLASGALDIIMENTKLVNISSDKVNKQIVALIGNGYRNVLPKTISNNTIIYDANEYELKGEKKETFVKNYNLINSDLNSLVNMSVFNQMSDQEKADTFKYLFDYYYYFALNKTFNVDISNNKVYNYANLVKPLYSSLYLAKKKNSLKGNKQDLVKFAYSLNIPSSQKQSMLNL